MPARNRGRECSYKRTKESCEELKHPNGQNRCGWTWTTSKCVQAMRWIRPENAGKPEHYATEDGDRRV